MIVSAWVCLCVASAARRRDNICKRPLQNYFDGIFSSFFFLHMNGCRLLPDAVELLVEGLPSVVLCSAPIASCCSQERLFLSFRGRGHRLADRSMKTMMMTYLLFDRLKCMLYCNSISCRVPNTACMRECEPQNDHPQHRHRRHQILDHLLNSSLYLVRSALANCNYYSIARHSRVYA